MVGADYDKIKNFIKIDAKLDTESDPKINAWTIRGSTFQVLGGFSRCLIFDESRWQLLRYFAGRLPAEDHPKVIS